LPACGTTDQTVLKRMGEEQFTRVLDCNPRRVAGVVTWLASDTAASVSGAVVPRFRHVP
jgi:hypothetical protein